MERSPLHSAREMRDALADVSINVETPSARRARSEQARALRRLDDHVIPRLEHAQAPILCVIGGSTGAGKSTLVNTMVGYAVSASSAVRPTTRDPLLLHNPSDAMWFDSNRILTSLTRRREEADADPERESHPHSLRVRALEAISHGVGVIDAPDLDSVVDDNRALARQLLDAADLWIFVTTAARYADAVPWQVLEEAGSRGIETVIVLNRIPPGATQEVAADLNALLSERGLGNAPVLAIDEQALEDGLLPRDAVQPLVDRLHALGADAERRSELAQQAIRGSVREVIESAGAVSQALDEERGAVEATVERIDRIGEAAGRRIRQGTADGTLLRGEVLARWQEVVGAADFTRILSRGISRLRDRISAFFRGRPTPSEPVEDAIEAGLTSLLADEFADVSDQVAELSRTDPALVGASPSSIMTALDPSERAQRVANQWQRELLAMVRSEGQSKRAGAQMMAIGVNVVGVALMIVIFASTGGLTGAEVGVAGATAAVAHKLLEAIFGDQAVRDMAKKAHRNLVEAADQEIAQILQPARDALPEAGEYARLTEAIAQASQQWSVGAG